MVNVKFVKDNWVAIIFILAVLGSFVVAREDSKTRDRAQHTQLVEGCKRNSARAALIGAYQHETAEARRASGDFDVAEKYDAFRLASFELIPVPEGLDPGDMSLAEVEPVTQGGKIVKYRLTKRATALQAAGCERAYP